MEFSFEFFAHFHSLEAGSRFQVSGSRCQVHELRPSLPSPLAGEGKGDKGAVPLPFYPLPFTPRLTCDPTTATVATVQAATPLPIMK